MSTMIFPHDGTLDPKWNSVNVPELLEYPTETLGFQLGQFLIMNNFELESKFECYDVFHVLTHIGTAVSDEVAMHFYLIGNGRKNLYSYLFALAGAFLFLHKIRLFRTAFRKGKKAHRFYDLNFLKLLSQPLFKIQDSFNIH